MNALTMIFAMLLSTASARMLKGHSCDSDYQSPNYWGKCVDGEYRNVEKNSADYELRCSDLVILIPKDIVGDKTLTSQYQINHDYGYLILDLSPNDHGYYVMGVHQDPFNGIDVDIEFYLDGNMVHKGNYQQNACFWEAGAITANDPNTESYEGSFAVDMPGHIIIKSLE
jgi:hypothetical protein